MARLPTRLVFTLLAGLAAITVYDHHSIAHAKGGGDDDDDDDNDKADKGGGGDDDDSGNGGDDDDDGDKDQPPVTAGGLFTIKTYPLRETERPLTLTKGLTTLKLSLGTDISAKGAFDSAGVSLDVVHGVSDNFSLIGGFDNAYNMRQFSVYGGFEGALAYDLVDFRLDANIHRNAVPIYQNFCDPPTIPGEVAGGSAGDPTCGNGSSATIDTLPSGVYEAGDIQFSLDLGFPFRYAFSDSIAIVALQTFMSIDFNSIAVDHVLVSTGTGSDTNTSSTCGGGTNIIKNHNGPLSGSLPRQRRPGDGGSNVDPNGTATCTAIDISTSVTGNSAKPDLDPSIGFLTSPIDALSIVVQAQLRVPDFDTQAGAFVIPVSARANFAPTHKLDVGLEFTLLNVIPPTGTALDNRFISAYVQARL